MAWLEKIFRGKDPARSGAPDSQDAPDSLDAQDMPRGMPRREVLQVVLRETMRTHGIPSDWIECRFLPDGAARGGAMQMQLVVRHGHDRLVPYVLAFQHSFQDELYRFEPKARQWAFYLGWQFDAAAQPAAAAAPERPKWSVAAQVAVPAAGVSAAAAVAAAPAVATPEPAAAAPAASEADEERDLEHDLKKLFAIRDAILKEDDGVPRTEFETTRPGLPPGDSGFGQPQSEFQLTQGFEPTRPGFEPTRPGGLEHKPPKRPA